MQSDSDNPGPRAAAAHRPELFADLRKRNERRARVRLMEARRKVAVQVERVIEMQRVHKRLGRG